MKKDAPRLALDALVAELAPRKALKDMWTWDEVFNLDLTDAQVAVIIEAEPHDLVKSLAQSARSREIAQIFRAPLAGNRALDIGYHFSAIIRVAAIDTLLDELRAEADRRLDAEIRAGMKALQVEAQVP
jgi:hypothetical protein